jgi:hypothetical protein
VPPRRSRSSSHTIGGRTTTRRGQAVLTRAVALAARPGPVHRASGHARRLGETSAFEQLHDILRVVSLCDQPPAEGPAWERILLVEQQEDRAELVSAEDDSEHAAQAAVALGVRAGGVWRFRGRRRPSPSAPEVSPASLLHLRRLGRLPPVPAGRGRSWLTRWARATATHQVPSTFEAGSWSRVPRRHAGPAMREVEALGEAGVWHRPRFAGCTAS